MFQNHRVFGANQTPSIPSDTLNFAKDTTHVCVLCLNRWYRFELIVDGNSSGSSGDAGGGVSADASTGRRVLTAAEVAEKLYAIQADAEARETKFGATLPVQALTSQDRYVIYC